jgi:hypothetical protein
MTKELHPILADLVPAVANSITRKFKGWVERDDVKQELYLWVLGRQSQYLECATSTADRRCTSALRRLQDQLGGETPWA